MKKSFVIFFIAVVIASSTFGVLLYRAYTKTPYTMAWDMAAHTYYGAELAQDIRHGHPVAFLNHINSSSIALWPFLHSLMLSLWFIVFGFSDISAVLMTIVFSSFCVIAGFVAAWLNTGKKSVIPGLLVAFFLISSPLFIAFSNYVMLEIFGVFYMLTMIITFCLNTEYDRKWNRILLSISFLFLFLIKINYGIYVLIPYFIFELLHLTTEKRKEYRRLLIQFLDWKNPKNIWNMLIALNVIALIVMKLHSGFTFYVFGREIVASGTKNLVYSLLCFTFLKSIIFYIRKKRLLDKMLYPKHISIIQIVVIPLSAWFLINPGRLPEFIRMSADRTTDFGIIGTANLVFYPVAFVIDYSCHLVAGIAMLALTAFSLFRWRSNPPVIRFLLILVLFGYAGLTMKLPNFAGSRFIFLQAPAIFFIAAFEIWRIGNDLRNFSRFLCPAYYFLLVSAIAVLVWFPIRYTYTERMPELIRESAPTMNPKLQRLADKIIKEIKSDERRICILGGSNEMSPYLLKWTIIKIHPEIDAIYIEAPVKGARTDDEKSLLENWLKKEEADAIIALEILSVSPFAQTGDFKSFHARKQTIVEYMEGQDIYDLAAKAGWGSKAAGIKLYKPKQKLP